MEETWHLLVFPVTTTTKNEKSLFDIIHSRKVYLTSRHAWLGKQSRTGQARQTKQDSNERDEGLKRNGYDAVYTRVNPFRDTERTYSLDKYMRVNLNHFILVLPDGFSLTTRWVDA